MDIILYRANANKVATRILLEAMKSEDIKLVSLEGGTLRNAIPRECFATLLVKDFAAAKATVEKIAAVLKGEYAETDRI